MGALSSLIVPQAEVIVPGHGDVPDQVFTVRGVGLGDLSKLIMHHGDQLEEVYQDNLGSDDALAKVTEPGGLGSLAKVLLKSAPEAMADLIALASDDTSPDARKMAASLPLPVQTAALSEIAYLTFRSEAEVGKFLETVIASSGIMSRVMGTLGSPAPLDGGSGEEAETPLS